MGRSMNVIGTSARIQLRNEIQSDKPTDYDRTSPPAESDERNEYRTANRRAVRYMYEKCQHGYRAVVVGPFHSKLYGTCGFGTKKTRAKAALQRNLANNFGFIGTMLMTDKDEADNVGLSASEVWHRANNAEREALKSADGRPISALQATGTAGQ